MGAFEKVFVNNDLYNVSSKEMAELARHFDPSVRKGIRRYRSLFKSIQNERKQAESFDGTINVRVAELKDVKAVLDLFNRVTRTGEKTGIVHWDEDDLGTRMKEGVILIATTRSGYTVGLISTTVKEDSDGKYGCDSVIMVAKLFREKKIADRLFDALIDWAETNKLTGIVVETLSAPGKKHIETTSVRRNDLQITFQPPIRYYVDLKKRAN